MGSFFLLSLELKPELERQKIIQLEQKRARHGNSLELELELEIDKQHRTSTRSRFANSLKPQLESQTAENLK